MDVLTVVCLFFAFSVGMCVGMAVSWEAFRKRLAEYRSATA